MREICSHKAHEGDRQPKIVAMGYVGTGGAERCYKIEYKGGVIPLYLDFVSLERNGITNETLLAIVRDRLEGFQAGPFGCDHNARALNFCEFALDELHKRTRERAVRGVENKHEK